MKEIVELGGPLLVAFILAAIVEGAVEYFIKPWFSEEARTKYPGIKEIPKFLALIVACILAFAYELDVIKEITKISAQPIWIGYILTGLLIGRGSNYFHNVLGNFFWSKPGPPTQ